MFNEDWQRDWFNKHRVAQYGFCEQGHHKSVRVIQCPWSHSSHTQVFCPTCEQ